MKTSIRTFSIVLLCLTLFASCKKNSDDDITDKTDGKDLFVSATSVGSFTQLQLQGVAVLKGFGSFVPLIQYDVDFYKITYYTTLNGSKVLASGLLGIPKNMPTTPALLSAQHGTMFSDADAPSNFPSTFSGFELGASAGFVTIIPDFIGYGESKNIVHPYYDMQSSAATVVDMIKATKYYLESEDIAINNKLFLMGYSEGGYVTMAAQKEIETNKNLKLTLTAAAEGAGGYDLTTMLAKVASVPTYATPSFLALFIQSYNTTYSFNRSLTDYFMPVYAAKIPALLDGSKTREQIDQELSTSPSALLNTAFFSSLSNPAAETAFKSKIAINSFPDWYPVCPTRMYHGLADEAVFFETSQTTYNRFISAGSKQLTLIPIPGGTHTTSVVPMVLDALPWMKTLAE
ncbi:lipoprotein, putative [Arcticibacter svalbardensis MN12-7]|uniref:Lipoprotein, putative n=1 Tax=Arcticibacter svalbardensis MN12-7 TaxID=1150600 RepID=R9GVY3_9SPHI|nr:lipase family protein [Arcticibacter svalbardensis]EOR95997.1 lipoprotein, putative [Arcticibacter svalbardensis MN12-7]